MNVEFLEKQILGCFLKDNTLLKETVIRDFHFSAVKHTEIFRAMTELSECEKAIDQVTLLAEFYDRLNQMGGVDYISSLRTNGEVTNFESYERTLLEDYKKRSADSAVQEYLSSEKKNIGSLVSSLERIEEQGIADEKPIRDVLIELAEEPWEERKKEMTGVPSGIKDLDVMTGGFQRQTSIIVGARPSMGKTATMLKFAMTAALNGDVPVVFSLEMSTESLLRRMIAARAVINAFLARNPYKLTELQKQAWYQTVGEISGLDMEIYDRPMQSIQDIRARVRKAKKKYEGRNIVVLIDYLTLIENQGQFHNDHAKVSNTSARLKAIAKEYDCPVITLAQLSRGVESRQDKRPMMSDLRESGSIEQDADIIMMLYRDNYYNKDSGNDNTLEINVVKHRDGPTGNVEVYYNLATGEIKDLVKSHAYA